MRLRVAIPGSPYQVVIEPRVLGRLRQHLEAFQATRIVIVTNPTVWGHWGGTVERALRRLRPAVISIPDGEKHKRLRTVETIAQQLLLNRADRGALLVALGGGVVGDITGFVAATYLRGVPYVQIPTTLLAMVDSSVGGKTGVNLASGKNLVGAFHHPKLVLVDPRVLSTLPERELHSGLYEVIKCGIIRNPQLFQFLEGRRQQVLDRDLESLSVLIRDSLAIKARVVEQDEREGGLRRILNFGHTAGHALEAAGGYRYFLHGEAVAWGMRVATRLAEARDLLDPGDAARIHQLIRAYGPLPTLQSIRFKQLASLLHSDKKTRAGVLHFVLPEAIGQVRVVSGIAPREVETALLSLAGR